VQCFFSASSRLLLGFFSESTRKPKTSHEPRRHEDQSAELPPKTHTCNGRRMPPYGAYWLYWASKGGYNCVYLLAPPPTWVISFYLGSALDGTASNYWNTGAFVNRVATDRTIRVVIAEDYTLMAAGLRKLLECEFGSVTTVGNGRELLDTVAASKPDVALVDIAMPLLNGIEATRQLGKISPATKVVIVTAHAEPQYVLEAFRAGASGFVLMNVAPCPNWSLRFDRVLSGHTYVTPLIAIKQLKRPIRRRRQSP